jgi:hypothetical protein
MTDWILTQEGIDAIVDAKDELLITELGIRQYGPSANATLEDLGLLKAKFDAAFAAYDKAAALLGGNGYAEATGALNDALI